MFETIYILSRTFIFLYFVVNYPDNAITAFSLAQIFSAIILSLLYYGFFTWYIYKLNQIRAMEDNTEITQTQSMFSDMNDFPFRSILHFFPGFMFNEVL